MHSVLFANKGRVLVSAGADRCIKLWDTAQARCARTISTPSIVNRASLSQDGHYCVSAHQDGRARLWDLRNGNMVAESADGTHGGAVTSVCFSRGDGSARVLSSCRDGVLRMLNGRTLESIGLLSSTSEGGAARASSGSVGGSPSAAGSGSAGMSPRLSGGVTSAHSRASGGGAAAASGSGVSGSGSLPAEALEFRRPGFEIPFNWCKAALSGGGKHALAACGGRRGEVVVWSAQDGKEKAVHGPSSKPAQSMLARTMMMFTGSESGGGGAAASSSGGSEGHSSRVIAVAWAPDARRMASSDEEGNVVLWGQ